MPEAGRSAQQCFLPGQIVVKFRDEADIGAVAEALFQNRQRFESINAQSRLDILNRKYKAKKLYRVFSGLRGMRTLPGGFISPRQAKTLRREISAEFYRRAAQLRKRFPRRQKQAASIIKIPNLAHVYKIEFDGLSMNIESICEQYRKDPDIEYAQPVYRYSVSMVPNDLLYNEQWSHLRTQAADGWDISTGSPQTVIAIVDTGVDYTHEDIGPNIWHDGQGNPGRDFVDVDTQSYLQYGFRLVSGEDYIQIDNDPHDYNGHGTHCAGVAAAAGNNGVGVAGVCHVCRIMPVRAGFSIIDPQNQEVGILEDDDIANAIYYAAENGADIISMSFGGSGSELMADAIQYAHEQGVLLVAAAGNSGSTVKTYPAAYENVISVAATTEQDAAAFYSNYGSWIDVSAPGSYIMSTVPVIGTLSDPSGYRELSGTSMACPYVAGMSGLVRSAFPDYSLKEIKEAVYSGTDDNGAPGWDADFGFGRVNVNKSLRSELRQLLARITAPEQSRIYRQDVTIKGTAAGAGFSGYYMEIGQGASPSFWTSQGIAMANNGAQPVFEDTLGSLDVSGFLDGIWTLRITVSDNLAQSRQSSVNFTLDKSLQTGWPQIMQYGTYHSSPVTGDIDKDGDLEIVTGSYAGIVYAWHHDGTLVSGWPQYMEGDSRSTPALADLDEDGYLEIVCCAATSYYPNVYVWRHDATAFPGWPKKVGNYISTSPVVADIDNDSDFEIIFPAEDWRVYSYHHDGTLVSGWPVRINRSQQGAKVVAGDVNHDGYKEIFSSDVNSVGATVYGWRHDGSVLPGWPKTWSESYLDIYPTAIADVNGDGNPEIIAGGKKLYVWDNRGNLLNGWPKELFDENNYRIVFMYPIIADMDNNGIPDIVSVDSNDTIHAWRGDGTYLSGWPVTFGYYNPAWTYYPVSADIDGDSYSEILVNAYDSYYGMENICVFNHDGTLAQGWPKSGVEHTSAPAVDDLDRDGDVEVVAIGNYEGVPDVNVYVWDLAGAYAPDKMEWPVCAHDARNTGNYIAEQARGSISGIVTLQGRQNHSAVITVELRNPGEAIPLETYYVTTAVDGSYLREGLPAGTYDVTAKAANSLRAKNGNVAINNGQATAGVDFFLLGGDANNDNYVAWQDYGILRNAYNTQAGDPRWDSRADFNADGFIAWQDYGILRANYGKAGE